MLKLSRDINIDDYKGILIDIDNTMYKYDTCLKHALEKNVMHFIKRIFHPSYHIQNLKFNIESVEHQLRIAFIHLDRVDHAH